VPWATGVDAAAGTQAQTTATPPAVGTAPITVTYQISTVTPGAVPQNAVASGPIRCANPRSKFIGAGINLEVTLVPGFWHFNVAIPGAGEGIEENFLILYQGPETTVLLPEGAVWWYRSECFAEDVEGLWFRVIRDSMDDYWPMTLPTFLSISGVTQMLPPTNIGLVLGNAPTAATTVTWPVQPAATPAAQQPATPATPAANEPSFPDITPGRVGQGEAQTLATMGWCSLSWYVAGQPEKMTLFLAEGPTTVGPFNGTLSCWPNRPSSADVGDRERATVAEAIAAGVIFSPAVTPFEPR
jgi:hypothetical protein